MISIDGFYLAREYDVERPEILNEPEAAPLCHVKIDLQFGTENLSSRKNFFIT